MRSYKVTLLSFMFMVMITFANAVLAQTTLTIETKNIVSVGETFTTTVNLNNVINLAGYQFDISYKPTVLEVVSVKKGTFISTSSGDSFCMEPTLDKINGLISKFVCARMAKEGVNGSGILATIEFRAITMGESAIVIQNAKLSNTNAQILQFTTSDSLVSAIRYPRWDVNQDGVIDILDLVLVGHRFGESITIPSMPNPDINDDKKVDINDLTIIAQHFGEVY